MLNLLNISCLHFRFNHTNMVVTSVEIDYKDWSVVVMYLMEQFDL